MLSLLFSDSRYCRKWFDLIRLTALFLWELVVSSLQVARDVLTPMHRSRPGIIAVPLDVKTDLEITAFANLVSLTPGNLSLDPCSDNKALYVHAIFIKAPSMIDLSTINVIDLAIAAALGLTTIGGIAGFILFARRRRGAGARCRCFRREHSSARAA